MVKIDKGLIKSIKDADEGRGRYSAGYIQVFYDKTRDLIFGVRHYSVGRCEYDDFHDASIVSIGNYAGKVTRNQLMDDMQMTLASHECY